MNEVCGGYGEVENVAAGSTSSIEVVQLLGREAFERALLCLLLMIESLNSKNIHLHAVAHVGEQHRDVLTDGHRSNDLQTRKNQ